jgi:predicted permease
MVACSLPDMRGSTAHTSRHCGSKTALSRPLSSQGYDLHSIGKRLAAGLRGGDRFAWYWPGQGGRVAGEREDEPEMRGLAQDLRYASRQLRKNPGFTAVAVLTLALGIGANSALFSVVNGVLLNPLPFPQPDQLIALHEGKPNFEGGSISYPNFFDWQKDNHTFASMAIARSNDFSLTGGGEAEQVHGEFISSDFFRVLGMKPLTGRWFLPGEDRMGGAPIALISRSLWEGKFSAAPDILGKGITLDGRTYTIVGVTPANFHLEIPGFREGQVYLPIGQWNNPWLSKRGAGLGIHGVGRLKPGVTLEQARADMDSVTRNLAMAFPDTDKGIGATLVPLKQQMVGEVRPYLLVLLGAVGFVLLIACVNVANLLLARSTARRREFALRGALGAGQGRMVRQLLTESVLIALVGGSLGVLLAAWGTRAALGVLPAALPRAEEIGLDSRVLLFTTALSLFAGILSGVTPAILKTSKLDLHDALKQTSRGISGVRHRAQSAFVVLEMALALVLLIGAGLMLRSLARLWQTDPGFNPHNVLSFSIALPPSMLKASPEAIRARYRDLEDKLASIPTVQAAALTWESVPMGADDEELFWLAGQPKPTSNNDMNWSIVYVVGPDYLKVMRIPLQRGRFLTAQDDEHARGAVVVDEVFAHKYFPNQDPIGKRLNFMNTASGQLEIVGVVGHVKQWGLDADDTQPLRAQMYLSCMQMPDVYLAQVPSGSGVVLRSERITAALIDSIRRTSQQMSRDQVLFGMRTMDEIIADSMAERRFSMVLLTVFSALALILASTGLYGVISYVVGQRTQEIGVRMAVGAEGSDILRLILKGAGKLAAVGVVAGLAMAFAVTRLMSGLLYGVRATDPLTFVAVTALLSLVALAAGYIPARRASKVDPMVALRSE